MPDGPRIEDLGINFRRIVSRVLSQYIDPEMTTIASACDAVRRRLSAAIEGELAGARDRNDDRRRSGAKGARSPALFARFTGNRGRTAVAEQVPGWERRWISELEAKAHAARR